MESTLNQTPKANRIHIAFFGRRNAGKSTLVNAFANQNVAIVSDVAGTTTDPVSKAMEILPLGPCLITDTAGLDDVGELGEMRVEKSLKVLETTDIAVWVEGCEERSRTQSAERSQAQAAERSQAQAAERSQAQAAERSRTQSAEPKAKADGVRDLFLSRCALRRVTVLFYHRGDSVEDLKRRIAAIKIADDAPGLFEGLVESGDRVLFVCPIDSSAPKGRLILPQVQAIRDCLDRHIPCSVCQVEELSECLAASLASLRGRLLVVTDSQAFKSVSEIVARKRTELAESSLAARLELAESSLAARLRLTSFSILFARQKGDLAAFLAGLSIISHLKDGDRVLIAEGCTHHRQCNDIGTTKIPKALLRLSGGKSLTFTFASGSDFPVIPPSTPPSTPTPPPTPTPTPPSFALVVQCGGCMLTRREMMRRIAICRSCGVPIVNYGILLAGAAGLDMGDVTV